MIENNEEKVLLELVEYLQSGELNNDKLENFSSDLRDSSNSDIQSYIVEEIDTYLEYQTSLSRDEIISSIYTVLNNK